MAEAPPTTPATSLRLIPEGCDQCGSTSLMNVGGGKFQCDYCGAFMLEREPPPLPPIVQQGDPNHPPPSPVNTVSAIEMLALDARGQVPAPPEEDIGRVLDKNGPKAFYRPAPLSKFVHITKTSGHSPIRIQYQVFFEQRRYEEVMQPHRGEQPKTEQLPPLWSSPPDPPRQIMVRRVPVKHQERMITCPRCTGRGRITCDHCNGSGRTDCMWCQGGVIVTTNFVNGKLVEDRHTCTSCQGRGYETCANCRGNGQVTCDLCQGQTRVLCTWNRVEEFTTPTTMHAISDDRDWSSYSWMSQAQGELIFDRAVAGRMDLTESAGPVAKLADQVMLRHNGELRDGLCHWSRVLVTRIPVVEVDYKVRSTSGKLFIYGRDQLVAMPGKKPVGCMGCLFWTLSALGTGLALVGGALLALL